MGALLIKDLSGETVHQECRLGIAVEAVLACLGTLGCLATLDCLGFFDCLDAFCFPDRVDLL